MLADAYPLFVIVFFAGVVMTIYWTFTSFLIAAPAPGSWGGPIDGGIATEALLVHAMVSKFCNALPLYG